MNKLAVDGGTPVRNAGFKEWPIFDELEEKLLLEVLHSGKWGGTGGALVPDFQSKITQLEKQFAQYHDAKYAIACANGTVAITIALQAAGVRPGDEVIIPSYTFIATATAALAFGAIPVFADIEEETLLINPDVVEGLITSKTKAIIAVHIAGAPANLNRLKQIAGRHGLKLIEDAAQAVGASWEGTKIGAIGDIGTFSFQSSKNLNAGEGGMIVTNSDEVYQAAWSYTNVGRVLDGAWYQHERIGQNYRITEFQAAILLAQMTRLEDQIRIRKQNAVLLDTLLQQQKELITVRETPGTTCHAYHLYMLRLAPEFAARVDKDDFIRKLNAEGLPFSYGYIPLNKNEAIQQSIEAWTGKPRIDSCPVSERMSGKEVLWLSQTVLLSDEEAMSDISEGLRKVIASYSK